MAEPLAVCLHAVGKAGPLLGKTVLVTGCGPIGVMTVICARRAGAETVIATDISEFALRTACAAGADRTINVESDADGLAEFSGGKGKIDVAFECSGAESALGAAGDITVPMMALTAKELRIHGSFRFHEEFFTAVTLMRRKLVKLGPLVTATLPFQRATDAFELASDRSQSMKVQLEFTS